MVIASALMLAVVVPAGPAGATPSTAATGKPGLPAADVVTTTVPPMGSAAARTTRKARGGKPRPPAPTPQEVPAPGQGTATPDEVWPYATRPFKELQLNLCNSGYAACFSYGQSIFEGGDLIYYLAPDVVTLNEICENDLASYLQPSLAESVPGGWTYYAFAPAVNRSTNTPIKCRNRSDNFGNAVLGRVPAERWQGTRAWSGEYATQDSTSEKRTYVCAYAIGDNLSCATHLSSSSEPVALAQCQHLLFSVVPAIRQQVGITNKTVVGGDLNMEYDTADPENVQKCVPGGSARVGDNAVQHVIYTNDLILRGTRKYGLTHSDHPGFEVRWDRPS